MSRKLRITAALLLTVLLCIWAAQVSDFLRLLETSGVIAALDAVTILLGAFLTFISIAGLLFSLLSYPQIRAFLSRGTKDALDIRDQEISGTHWDAIIFLLGNAEIPAFHMRDTGVDVDAVGLVVTEKSQTEVLDTVRAVAAECRVSIRATELVADHESATLSFDLVMHMLHRLREEGADKIAVDVTGGTKPMSIGAFNAAVQSNVAVIYTASDYSTLDTRLEGQRRVRMIFKPVGEEA